MGTAFGREGALNSKLIPSTVDRGSSALWDENSDLYVIGVDGRGKFQLTNTPDVDIGPSWVAR